MARKRPKQQTPDEDAPPKLAKPPEVGTGLKALLERAGLASLRPEAPKPKRAAATSKTPQPATGTGRPPSTPVAVTAPSSARPERPRAPYTTAELSALNQAYRGVAPIRRAQQKRAGAGSGPKPLPAKVHAADPADEAARERLAELVGGGVRFEVHWDEGFVQALRAGGASTALARAGSARFAPEASLDLHGRQRADAQRALGEFVRSEHRRGARRLLVIVGKGQHSEDGVGVLGAAAIETLTRGVAAPLVTAVASAHPTLGGRGALAVVLR